MTAPSREPGATRASRSQPARLSALRDTGILLPGPDEALDSIARFACRLLDAAGAVVAFDTAEGDIVAGSAGAGAPGTPAPGDRAPARQVVEAGTAVEWVRAPRGGAPGQSLLGVPVCLPGGMPVAALYVVGGRERAWSPGDRSTIAELAAMVERELERRMLRPGRPAGQPPEQIMRLLNILPVGLYACDGLGQVAFYNSRAASLWGASPPALCREEEAYGSRRLLQPDGSPVPPDALPGATALRDLEIVANREFRMEPDRIVLVSWGPSTGESERVLGAVVVMHDVTDLRRASRVRDELLSLVSHELRSPLTVINGMARALDRRLAGKDAEIDALLADVLGAGKRLERVVENMLLLARLGHDQVEPEPVPLWTAAQQALGRHLRDFPPSRVVLDIPDRDLLVAAVPDWLQLILVNLLNNAEQYGDGRQPHVLRAEAGESVVVISVCNTGTAAEGEVYASWFEPFYRGPATARTVAGAGLGLAVAKRLAEASGGSLSAARWEAGPGTAVMLTLPRINPDPGDGAGRI